MKECGVEKYKKTTTLSLRTRLVKNQSIFVQITSGSRRYYFTFFVFSVFSDFFGCFFFSTSLAFSLKITEAMSPIQMAIDPSFQSQGFSLRYSAI